MRWRLLDEVVEIRKGKSALCRARIPSSEFSPEVLMIEMMAQAAGLLLGAQTDFLEDVVFAKIQDASFSAFDAARDLEVSARCDDPRADGAWFETQITQNGAQAAQANLLLMNVGHIQPQSFEPVSFHKAFMEHYQVRSKLIKES